MCVTRLNLLILQLGIRAKHHAGPLLVTISFSLSFPKQQFNTGRIVQPAWQAFESGEEWNLGARPRARKKGLLALGISLMWWVFSYFEKGCQCAHDNSEGNMGYDQYTVPDTVAVEHTFVDFLQHSQTWPEFHPIPWSRYYSLLGLVGLCS